MNEFENNNRDKDSLSSGPSSEKSDKVNTKIDKNVAEQMNAYLFSDETPARREEILSVGTGRNNVYTKAAIKWTITAFVCIIFGFFGVFLGVISLSSTSVIQDTSLFEKLVLKNSGVYTNKVVVDQIEGTYTGERIEVIDAVLKTVVEINVISNAGGSSSGSGVVIDKNGYIVTNQHVVFGAKTIKVKLYDGREYTAEIFSMDKITDVAFIKIEPVDELDAATLGVSANVRTGQDVIIVGNPMGIGLSVSGGMISFPAREITVSDETGIYIQTDAAVNPGNSGGGMFDAAGNLIGIVSAKTTGSNVENLGYAIPVDTVKLVMDDLFKYGYVKGRAALGITIVTIETQDAYNYYNQNDLKGYLYNNAFGLYVISSNYYGEIKKGDLIIGFNGASVSDTVGLTSALRKLKPGDSVEIVLKRVKVTDEGAETEQYTHTIVLKERDWVDAFE